MIPFDKDYNNLTAEEKEVYEKYNSLKSKKGESLLGGFEDRQKRRTILKDNYWIENYESIFPQNHLSMYDIANRKIEHIAQLQKFEQLLNRQDISERDILNFISVERAYFIIGSIFQRTSFGHHDRYIFREIALPPDFQADFLLIGKNSLGFHFVFIELENPYGDIILKDGNFGNSIRKGLNQIDDWKNWIERNIASLRSALVKTKSPNSELPKEFFEYDSTRFNYVVVAGRRSDYSEKANLKRRKHMQDEIRILHYDNLIDESQRLLQNGHY